MLVFVGMMAKAMLCGAVCVAVCVKRPLCVCVWVHPEPRYWPVLQTSEVLDDDFVADWLS